MGVAAAILLFFFTVFFEFSQRRRLGLKLSSTQELKEYLSRSKEDPEANALKSLLFAAVCLFMFSIWEGCIRAVINREWGLWSFLLGLASALGLLFLRQKRFKAAPSQVPWTLMDALLVIGSYFFLAAPYVSLVFGAWFFVRLKYYQKKQTFKSAS